MNIIEVGSSAKVEPLLDRFAQPPTDDSAAGNSDTAKTEAPQPTKGDCPGS